MIQSFMAVITMSALSIFQPMTNGEVRTYPPGTYHFRAATNLTFYVSNHDHDESRAVFCPILGVTNAVLRGHGTHFVFHGCGVGLLLRDTLGVRVEGISFDWARPMFSEGTVRAIEKGRSRVAFDESAFPMLIDKDGYLMSIGEDWVEHQHLLHYFDAEGKDLGIRWFSGKAERTSAGDFWLDDEFPAGTQTLMIRNGHRPSPAVVLYRADETFLQDISVYAAFGMAILVQRSRDVSLVGSGTADAKTCGVFPPPGRRTALAADCTHFSNCRGTIRVENCFFRGTVDDAINVHATSLEITGWMPPNRLRCKYRHNQSFGFETFLPGERVTFIHGPAMENGEWRSVKSVTWEDPQTFILAVEGGLPDGYGIGDAIENADAQPNVIFRNNIVDSLAARGCLITTSGKVRISGNHFRRTWSPAVLFAGDVQDWFESGACRDVVISNNIFEELPLSPKAKAVILVAPHVKKPGTWRKCYHTGIQCPSNRYEQCLKPPFLDTQAPACGAGMRASAHAQ